jgi:hypothetical protein
VTRREGAWSRISRGKEWGDFQPCAALLEARRPRLKLESLPENAALHGGFRLEWRRPAAADTGPSIGLLMQADTR